WGVLRSDRRVRGDVGRGLHGLPGDLHHHAGGPGPAGDDRRQPSHRHVRCQDPGSLTDHVSGGRRQHHLAGHWRGVLGVGARAGGACCAQRAGAAAGTYIGHYAYACKREGEVMTEAFNTRTDCYANRAKFEESPMQTTAPHLMRAYARQPVSFVRGNGARLWDEQGVEYLDAIAGVAVTSLGHAHPEIAAVIAEQAGALLHTSNVFRIGWQEQLGERLCALTGMESAFFCNSGAEANETALKLARLHAHRRQVARPQILVMGNAFHGRTLATLAATDNAANQQGFGPLLPGFLRAPYGDISAVRQAAEQSPDIVAVLIESVQGEGGIRVASAEYLRELRALCDQRDWLLMLDEIQAGMGRTGAWFGYAHAGISPDVVTLAKALGNGFPIGACLARGIAADLFSPGQHGSTFGGNPLACRVAC